MAFSWSPSWCSQWSDRHWGIKCSRCSCRSPLECGSQGQTLLPADNVSLENSSEKWDKPWKSWPIRGNRKRNRPGILNRCRSCNIYRSWCTFLHLLGLRPENIHHYSVTLSVNVSASTWNQNTANKTVSCNHLKKNYIHQICMHTTCMGSNMTCCKW